MDDLHLIDCVEKIRAHCLEQDPALGERLGRIRSTNFRDQPDAHFKRRLVALALGIDDTTPAGMRLLRKELSRGELSAYFSADEINTPGKALAVAEEASLYSAASGEMRARLATSLAAFRPADEKTTFAHRLAGEPGLPAAATFVGKLLPALRGQKVYEYLIEVGYPAAIPSADSIRFLHRLGLMAGLAAKAASEGAARRAFHSAVERLARLTGSAMGEIDWLIGLYSGARRRTLVEPVCTTDPHCEVCPATNYCAYFRFRGAAPKPARKQLPIKEWAVDERPRERLLAGETLRDAELLAIILRTGSGGDSALDLARELLRKFGTLHRLAAATPEEIVAARVRGIGRVKAAEIRAAMELGARIMKPEADDREKHPPVSTSRDIFDMYRPRFMTANQEEFWLLALNAKNKITREVQISVGTLNSSLVHPRDVFHHALRESAAGTIFVHNHPSGDPAPSNEDRALTKRLVDGGKLLGIKVLDHVIVGATRYYSFADEGALG